MFNKLKGFLKRDIFSNSAKGQKAVTSKESHQAGLSGRLLVILLVVLFVFGFWAGGYYGPEMGIKIKQGAQDFYWGISQKLSWLPSWSTAPNLLMDPSQLEAPSGPYKPITSQEEAVMQVVKRASPAVVSIVITKDVPVSSGLQIIPLPFDGGESPLEFKWEMPDASTGETKKQRVGGGTGFVVSTDGLFITNRHVVEDDKAGYSLVANDGQEYKFKILDKDPFQDLAICQIEKKNPTEKFTILKLGDSDNVQIGQTVVAIGNALGQFNNTVSVGVISGLGRNIVAEGGGLSETLEDIIQTDAAINRGNSGGPLLNLKGEVVGINSAVASDAQSIGFAILVNKAKRDIESLQKQGKIVYPFLGVRYVLVTPELKDDKNLSVDYGAFIVKGKNADEPAVVPGAAAAKAGVREGDIVLEADGQKITPQNSLSKMVQNKNPGDKMTLKILRGKKEITVEVTLGEKSSE